MGQIIIDKQEKYNTQQIKTKLNNMANNANNILNDIYKSQSLTGLKNNTKIKLTDKYADTINIGEYLHKDGSINTTPGTDVIGICVIPANTIVGSPEARFMSVTGCTEDGKQSNKEFATTWGPGDTKTYAYSYINGKKNTKKIVDLISVNTAAKTCELFNPGDNVKKEYGKGNWYLPALGELQLMFNNVCNNNYNDYEHTDDHEFINNPDNWYINKKLTELKNNGLDVCFLASNNYWSSTEYAFDRNDRAWPLNIQNSGYSHNGTKPIRNCVRPWLSVSLRSS